MGFVITPYMLAQAASALISLIAAGLAWRRHRAPEGKVFALLLSAVAIWTAAVTVEEGSVAIGAKILFSKISYLGAVNAAPLFLVFAWMYRHAGRRPRAWAALLWVVPAAALVLTATNELHHLIWVRVTPSAHPGDHLAVYVHGPAWWVYSAYCLLLNLVATATIGRAALSVRAVFARQSAVFLGAVAIVWTGFLLYVLPGNPLPGLDLPALSFALAGALILWGLNGAMILALSPIARDTLVEAMPDGLIVEDMHGRVVDVNPRALSLLRRTRSIIGWKLSRALESWPALEEALRSARQNVPSPPVRRDGRLFEATLTSLRGPRDERLGRMVTLADVTQRRRAEEAGEESQRSLRTLLASAQRHAKELELLDQVRTSLTLEQDLPDIFRTVVEGIARAFGYTQVSLYLLQGTELVLQHQVGYPRVIQRLPVSRGIMGRVVRTGRPELVASVKDDPEFIGAIQGVTSEITIPLRDLGRPVGVLNVESTAGVEMGREDLRLMTALGEHVSIAFSKARLYGEARDNEERYRTLVNSLGEGVAVVDFEERFVFANPAAEAVFGVGSGGLSGRSLVEFMSPEGMVQVRQQTGLRRQGKRSTYEVTIRRPDGQERQLELNAAPQRGPDGEVNATLGIFRDVTELRRLQTVLERERTLLLTLIDNLPDYIYLKDRESRFILVNRAQAMLVGAEDARDVIGKTDHDFVPREFADRYREGDQRVLRSRKPVVNLEELSQSSQGERRRVLTTKVPVFDASGEVTGLVGISRDVTDLIRAEEERSRLQEQLQQAQKMEAVGRLAGGIAHDFNNILTVITGYCEMALLQAEGRPELHSILEEIKRAARRSTVLVSHLLAFSRRQVLLPRVFDLTALVDDMGAMLRRLLGEDIRLEAHHRQAVLFVNADPGQIEQVIMNLAVNARDAMAGGGCLRIETDRALLSEEDLRGHPEVTPGDFACLSVSDTGHGMDAATVAKVFEPFFTTKEVGKGTGLGLATVYGIVRQSRGHVTCRSEVDRGTTFIVYLPRAEEPQRAFEGDKAGDERPLQGTERILLVEDDESVRSFVSSTLQRAGYTVFSADTGTMALEQLSALPAVPDLLLTDVIMPGMDGRVLAREVIRRLPFLPVLLMSGYAEVSAGAEPFVDDPRLLRKPFSPMELLSRVRAALDGVSTRTAS